MANKKITELTEAASAGNDDVLPVVDIVDSQTKKIKVSSLKTSLNIQKSDVGLANVDDTSDLSKPISTATQSALDLKANSADVYTKTQSDSNFQPKNANIQSHILSASNPHGVTKAQVGLGNVDDTSDANKPVSNATQTALGLKANSADVYTKTQIDSQKGSANGIATLDVGGKVPGSQLPSTIMEFKGTWDASTNTPTLANGTPSNLSEDAGHVYVCSVGGTVDFGAGNVVFAAGDWVILSANLVWEKSVNSNAVASVNGYQGAVILAKSDVGLGNVDNTSDANKPVSGATQTALDTKQNSITGAASTIASSNLTASRALTSNTSGKVAVSAVTSTELDYLSGVTSAIQTQLNGKESTIAAGTTAQYWRGDKSFQTLDKTAVGLSNVDNTSDLAKPLSSDTIIALGSKQDILVSAGNIKTINGSSILGSGDLAVTSSNTSNHVLAAEGEPLSVGDYVYMSRGSSDGGRIAGAAYKADASNSNRISSLGFVKSTTSGGASQFTEGFESGDFTSNGWTVVNGSQVNRFFVGTAAKRTGAYSAYISNDGGTTNAYTTSSSQVVYFYKDFTLSGTNSALKFWYKQTGEVGGIGYDLLFVVIDGNTVPVVPVAGTELGAPSGGSKTTFAVNTAGAWQQGIVSLAAYGTGNVRVIFGWKNDSSGGTQPPVAIDDIEISQIGSATIQYSGVISGLSGLSAGSVYYLSATTPGTLTTTAPETLGRFIVPVLVATANTEGIMLSPDPIRSPEYPAQVDLTGTTINWLSGSMFYRDVTAATTFTFSNLTSAVGKEIHVAIRNTSASIVTITWPTIVRATGFVSTVLANRETLFSFRYMNGKVYATSTSDMG